MSSNPLELVATKGRKGAGLKRDQQAWIDRGNRLLWGEEPDRSGAFMEPQRHLEWRCENGNYFIALRGNGRSSRQRSGNQAA